ncbi:single-stranded DNA-binding protein [Atopobacter phocae]|uniref:single-stranded DNA-binding protein n=1 Tax=Atopobacter phocae TaxID=136492 RepID=UPI0004720B3B|nr:single-stranded DNA-binding protein [Atopobacter phocae]
MINNVSLTGRLTRDIELKHTQSGIALTNFNLAVNRTYKDDNGNTQADFINCVAWKKTAEIMAEHLKKGSLIGIEGSIQTRNYENQQGQKVYVTEVLVNRLVFLESRQDNQSNNNPVSSFKQQELNNSFPSNDIDISDDDLPF